MECSIALTGADYVLVASDMSAARSIVRMKSNEDKTKILGPNLVMAYSGDTVQFAEYVERNLRLYQMRYVHPLRPPSAASWIRRSLADSLRSRHPYSVNLLLGGVDLAEAPVHAPDGPKGRPSLYWIDYLGTLAEVPFAAHGYGSYFVLSLFDRYHNPQANLEEGLETLRRGIAEIQKRLIVGLENWSVKLITRDGVKEVDLASGELALLPPRHSLICTNTFTTGLQGAPTDGGEVSYGGYKAADSLFPVGGRAVWPSPPLPVRLNILLINVPLAWTAALMELNPLLIFSLSFLAIVPLEKLSEFGGHQFALYCGETLGEFVSITLANIVEVNLAIFLLFECQLRLVQSTVIGVILLHALLVPGIAFVVGGARVLEQKLKPVHTQLNASLLFLGVVTLLLPVAFFSAYPNPHELVMANTTREGVAPSVLTPHSLTERAIMPTPKQLNYIPEPRSPRTHTSSHLARHNRQHARAEAVEIDQTLRSSDGVLERNPIKAEEKYLEVSAHTVAVSDTTRKGIQKFSHGYALMLVAVYILSRIYLHRHPLNDDLRLDRRPDLEHTDTLEKPMLSGIKRKPRVVGPGPVIILLIIVVGLIAVTAEFLVSSVEHVQQVNRLSSEWFGLILLPMISYSADALVTVAYCCRKAWRHRYSNTDDLQAPEELARGRSIDLSIQFLLFWLPALVLLAWITNKPLTLLFDVFEVAAAIGACLLVNYTTQDGKTNWVEGFMLIVFYFMIALAAWFYNGQLSVFELLQSILDLKGKSLIQRSYRDDVSPSHIERFLPYILDLEEEGQQVTPCFSSQGVNFMHIRHSNLYLLALSKRNTNAAEIILFLHKLVSVLVEYFKELEEESIRDNFVIIYELLDEMMDFGYPQTTESKILQEYITQESHKLEIQVRPPVAVTNAVSWRSEGIRYRKNEVFLDVIESVNLLVNADGNVIRSEILGAVKMKCYLSGMPELRLGLNDKVMFENTGRTSRGKSIEMEDVKFHQCVRLSRFENDRTISFIPPDGEFELMSYRLSTPVKPLIWVEAAIESHKGSRIEYMVKVKAQFKRRSTANNVEIYVPVPDDADSPKFRASTGSVQYAPDKSAFVWKIKQLGGAREFLMRAHFGLPSVRGAEEIEKKPPITVRFEIPYFTVSGIQWLDIINDCRSTNMSAHIEEVSDHEGHDHGHEGHDHEGHEGHDHSHEVELDPTSNAALEKIQSRPERKARKALISLGLKKVPGITRVTMKRPRNILLVVANPEVFKSPNSDVYIVFGEAKTEDIAAAQQAAAAAAAAAAAEREAQEATGQDGADETPKTLEDLAGDAPGTTGKAPEAPEEEEEVDETGVDPKDIELVIQQVGCSRAKAVKVLKESGGDLINARCIIKFKDNVIADDVEQCVNGVKNAGGQATHRYRSFIGFAVSIPNNHIKVLRDTRRKPGLQVAAIVVSS
ncbi:Adaptor complexes medium subunit family [Rhizoctonia solani]|uniref:Nascent polypeptide-associated complex subunit beta n=1 Tax=Rhizoctonia solani TaxID=456999 RepID=A0A8H8P5H4_9AGAM|nr:Adaptor complexes medium subunit family [Rhizoctonia solani]QRW25615.1 Adaptor complexes medium subunit family [Rhizoctonia solani]